MNKELLKMKKELKELAKRIKNGKIGRKPDLRFENEDRYEDWKYLDSRRDEFRHRHIAYCTIRGRTRDQIEKPREDNLPNDDYIYSIIGKYNEAIRASQKRLAA